MDSWAKTESEMSNILRFDAAVDLYFEVAKWVARTADYIVEVERGERAWHGSVWDRKRFEAGRFDSTSQLCHMYGGTAEECFKQARSFILRRSAQGVPASAGPVGVDANGAPVGGDHE